jgi:hypothetical protein
MHNISNPISKSSELQKFSSLREHSVCPICIGSVSRKNNQDEIVGVFLWEMVWPENSLSQLEGGLGFGREHVRLEKWAVKGKGPKWRPVIYVGVSKNS